MSDLLTRAYAPAEFRRQGHALIDQLADYLERVDDYPANPYATPEESLEEFRALLARGAGAEEIFERVIARSVHLHHPAYLGHQVVPPAPLSALSDVAASLLNTGMAIFEMGRPGTAMERLVIERFAELLELDSGAGGFLTSGGSLANLTALLAARARHESRDGGGRYCLLVNEHAHYCIERAVRVMGWGADGIVHVPTDDHLRMRTELIDGLLQDARDRGLTPIALVGSACTTATGTYDPITALADAAEKHQLWLHIDGAHGAAVRLDPARRHLVEGLERVDSLTLDFHKMLMAPAITTGLFFRRGTDAYRTFQQRAEYLLTATEEPEDWANIARRSFECTKRMLSLRIFTLLSVYGSQLFVDYVSRVGELGQELARGVNRRPELELFMPPDINIVCFRFHRPDLDLASRNGLNGLIRTRMTESGQTYIVQTTLDGEVYLRCTLTNAFTTTAELDAMLEQVVALGNEWLALRANLGA
ncbi:L-2,4-diaminobutyrate decarboxylase [Lewinella marina]|uniref:Pyridoxal-dependent decarboxylase n=1 Tax=Neolewinella marina TaxID=438751 RepID=A0A2G0CGP2_9BACT|nr:pyridoxal-dependent decarboxylase [Neolewinella marina]NJB86390.1 L-2,4-diaminobutyrate decarboxylase [Neolewinella marina]PHK99142.1 pyridoxal-dependent decarboxylase [Neolewinella marina]